MKEHLSRGATSLLDIFGCQRCGQDHKQLKFKPLSNAADEWAWWAMCPTTREPLLCRLALEETKVAEYVYKYPDSLDPQTMSIVLGLLRNQEFEPKPAVHALYQAVGFGLGKWEAMGRSKGAGDMMSHLDAANFLESLHSGARSASSIDWGQVLSILITLLQTWLKK